MLNRGRGACWASSPDVLLVCCGGRPSRAGHACTPPRRRACGAVGQPWQVRTSPGRATDPAACPWAQGTGWAGSRASSLGTDGPGSWLGGRPLTQVDGQRGAGGRLRQGSACWERSAAARSWRAARGPGTGRAAGWRVAAVGCACIWSGAGSLTLEGWVGDPVAVSGTIPAGAVFLHGDGQPITGCPRLLPPRDTTLAARRPTRRCA